MFFIFSDGTVTLLESFIGLFTFLQMCIIEQKSLPSFLLYDNYTNVLSLCIRPLNMTT